MTPAETAFCEEMLAVCRKHGYASLEAAEYAATGDRFSRQPASSRTVIHMIGFENLCLSRYCIESILSNTTAGTYRLILTNNGSADGTKEYFDQIGEQFKHVTVIHESENTGFQAPNEKAFKLAREWGAVFFCPINNDIKVPPGWLEKLLEPLETNPKGAISGPFGGCSRVNADMCGCDDTKLEYLEFSCAAIRVAAVTTPALFAPFLSFIYGEDLQLALDLQYKGWTIHRASFRVEHRGSQTAGAHPAAKERCAEANRKNLGEMKRRYAHWNKVRRFDHPIILRRAYASGDILLATPVIRALKEKYALCPIYFETDRPEVLEGNPCLELAATPQALALRPDKLKDALIIDLNYEATPERHVIDSYAIAAGLEPGQVGRKLELHCAPLTVPEMASGKWCAIHVGPTSWPGKNWPMDRWATVIQVMRQRGYHIALLGDDRTLQLAPTDYDGRGQSSVRGLAGILKASQLFIGLDSFPAHMASAVNIPRLVLFGITNPLCFAVYDDPKVGPAGSAVRYGAIVSDPNHPDTGRRNREANVTFVQTDDSVMRTISVDQVLAAIDEILK